MAKEEAEGQDAPREVWEEQISFIREKLAERVKAAAEGNEEASLRVPETQEVLNLLLKGYADRFKTKYTLPDK